MQGSFLRREILREILRDTFLGQQEKAVFDGPNLTVSGWRREVLRHSAQCFPFLGSAGRNINQSHHLGIVPGFGDHRAAVGMTNQQYRAVLRVDKPIR